ncbi:M15 family metallopeptidase [Leucobacter soli]|uniref:D-alanyl-D-alanine carboxypeptidase-like core domain-containing protein n=1 Tax=Leucobacter soli TaxID=2812850 RepID=A0A916K0U3_9MICO|nr:M15 family metallopeptidase [Leucobacter soli]CAG7616169.1 hypothetical protein LEUCIP111803_01959 [Leucobacter soli]
MRTFRTLSRDLLGGVAALALIASGAAPALAAPRVPVFPSAETAAAETTAAPPATAVVAAALGIAKPTLSGSTRVGGTMRAKVRSTGTVKPKLHYDWLRDGVRIGGAHTSSYTLKSKDRTHRITVRVRASAAGQASVTKTSAKSIRIRPRAIDDPKSSQVVVNKHRPLKPKKYKPSGLRLPKGIANGNGQPMRGYAARAVEKMHQAAQKDGVELRILSAYRSYALQKQTFDAYVARDGRKAAETYSARPGHSEHQTGLAVDFGGNQGCAFDTCFASTAAGKWLKKNAAKYGFIMRYPKGYTKITGYIWEPYHFRYVGKKVAKDMKAKKIRTLEQYRGLKAAPDYKR